TVEIARRALRKELDDLRDKIRNARVHDFSFLTGSLAFSEAFGPKSDVQDKDANDAFAKKEPEAVAYFSKLATTPARQARLRQWLFRHAIDHPEQLEKVAGILPRLDPLQPPKIRPAEAQYLAILAEDRAKGLPGDLIQDALKVRQAAEKALV